MSVVSPYSNTPIGCAGPYDGSTLTCNITWLSTNVDGCSQNQDSNPSSSCGVTIQGLTVAGLERGIDRVQTDSVPLNTNEDVNNPYLVQFLPAQFSEHSFWDGYTFPDMKVR